MKKILVAVLLFTALAYSAQSQQTVGIVTSTSGSVTFSAINDIEYKSINLSAPMLCEIVSSLPVDIKLVEGDEGSIEISYPKQEEEWLDCRVMDGIRLIIAPKKDAMPKSTVISPKTPIFVKLSTSKLRSIIATADMDLEVECDRFHSWLQIISNSTMSIVAESISADSKIEILSNSTSTYKVKHWNTNNLVITNMGFLLLDGSTTAKSIEHTSSGIDNITLDVNCHKLDVTSVGSGTICYSGTADDVNIVSMGKATIRTSELNK